MAYPTCPACGEKDPHSMVRCGMFRAYICSKHCYEGCQYFSDFGTSVVHCFFREHMIEERKAAKSAAENKA